MASIASTVGEEKSKGNGKNKDKEGSELLGSPTFEKLENGRFRCVETGHELPEKEMESYSHSKRCRLGLIEFALSKKKPPLTMFKQDPNSRSKLICKLTGDTINKSEEHIWKHINGSKFLAKLEKKEAGMLPSNGMEVDEDEQKTHKGPKASTNGVKKGKKNRVAKGGLKGKEPFEDESISEEPEPVDNESNSEELDFWCPPVGNRWDFDDGKDRWDSGTDSENESDDGDIEEEADEDGVADENGETKSDGADESDGADNSDEADENGVELEESEELTKGTKRMTIEVGPSSFASRKKKRKTNTTE